MLTEKAHISESKERNTALLPEKAPFPESKKNKRESPRRILLYENRACD